MVLLVIQLVLLLGSIAAMGVLALVFFFLMWSLAGDGTPYKASPTDWLMRVLALLVATAIVVLLFATLYIAYVIVEAIPPLSPLLEGYV